MTYIQEIIKYGWWRFMKIQINVMIFYANAIRISSEILIWYKEIYRLNAVTTNISLASFTKKRKQLLCGTKKGIIIIILKIIKSKLDTLLSETSIYIEK